METTRKDIEAETRRALDEIRKEVAGLTLIATEKVTRKSLDDEDHRRLIQEALSEVDFSPSPGTKQGQRGHERPRWKRSPTSTRARCSRSPRSSDSLDRVHEELGEFADAMNDSQDLRVFFFSPYFSSQEKKEGISRMVEGADENFVRFLEVLAERHRMPAIFRIRRPSTTSGVRRTSCCR